MSNYLSVNNAKISKKFNFGKFLISFSLLLVLFVSFFGSAFVSYIKYEEPVVKQAEAEEEPFDLVNWFFCRWGEDSLPRLMYNGTQTSDLEYELYSKSSLNSGIGKVDGGWNGILNLFGYDFVKTNESILGTKLSSAGIDPTEEAEEIEFNSGPKVNVFDRFGVAGLKFTSYAGEWKYFIVDPCSKGEPIDPKAGLFYPERLEPMSPWEEIGDSKDIRTNQFLEGFGPAFGSSFNNHVANFFFGFTKFFVIFAIVLINFAFSDVVSVLGIHELIAGDGNGSSSLFKTLYDNIFIPLAFIMFAVTAMYMLYIGLVKRQFRNALGILARSIALFVAAVVVGVFPLQFVALPNNIAVVGQSIIISAMGGSLTDNKGLCNTDKGSTTIIENANGSLDYQQNQDILTAASENMRSVIACQFWQNFLFKPWTEGQFGVDYNSLWANDNAPGVNNSEKTLGNENDEWVGDAAVPMGNGEFINNWAIFQLSTQTNAHSPIGRPNEVDITSLGVGRDWWRVVDAVSNYDEEEVKETVTTSQNENYSAEVTSFEPKETKVTKYWDTWVGNNSSSRIWISISSLFIAIIGLSMPFIFALFSSLYAIGIALLMSMAPIMLLLGIYQPHGWEIFKSWAQEVINLTIKRIVFGFLLILSLIFTTAAIKIMNEVGWVQGLLIIIVFSLILWKFKDKIINSFASVSFAATSLNSTGNVVNKMKGIAKGTARVTTAAGTGAVASKKHGGSFRSGVFKGARAELKQQMYRSNSDFARAALTEKERKEREDSDARRGNVDKDGNTYCQSCGEQIPKYATIGRMRDGSIICENCSAEGIGGDDVVEQDFIASNHSDDNDDNDEIKEQMNRHEAHRTPKSSLDTAEGMYNEDLYEDSRRDLIDRNISSQFTPEEAQNLIIEHLASDITDHQVRHHIDYVEIPEMLKPYLNDGDVKTALIEAWKNGDYDFIQSMYAAALTQWTLDKSRGASDVKFEDIEKRLAEEVIAQSAVRKRKSLSGARVDSINTDVYNVNGSKRYAAKDEDIYTKPYKKIQKKNEKLGDKVAGRDLEIKKLQNLVNSFESSLSIDELDKYERLLHKMNTRLKKASEETPGLEEAIARVGKVTASDLEDRVHSTNNIIETRRELNEIELSMKSLDRLRDYIEKNTKIKDLD